MRQHVRTARGWDDVPWIDTCSIRLLWERPGLPKSVHVPSPERQTMRRPVAEDRGWHA